MTPSAADWTRSVPDLAGLDQAARDRLRALCRTASLPAGTRVFGEGSPCQAYLILLSGEVRVQKVAESGREIVLYRVAAGETCIVTTACLMSGVDYDAEGIADSDITAQILPASGFRELLGRSEPFRDFVFRAYGSRISGLLMLIDEVAFGRMDRRLAACLLARAKGSGQVAATHQDLALELGSAREVVSRLLKDFERRGWVVLSRGSVALTDCAALAEIQQTV
ncbi:transcriptional regulator Crp/Fnr family [Paramagnetospirillum magnetotacticum MS-1]|uniref:Transcriptional regulator Crp/Fnr family n=1 Tax=Paramagnetospirillum magnetotacticum MS-1 TaxID=272627 RepID=A0A0C2Z107_PARME|nr:Crp/Fnr family transcriptional regulator [Paramagnetospirillum magnetotacticum]KIM00581.1 transcriptional regulator Crp/Fnr family [Paramagnetospirillum magnetotacticum MS-1]